MTDSPPPIDKISHTASPQSDVVSRPSAPGARCPLEQVSEGSNHPDPAVTERERRLVEAARSGDPSAIEVLYRDHYNTIYRYALYRVGSPQAAEDVSSQVFLGMVRGLPRFRWQGKPVLAWLYGIAQKQVAMFLRDSKRGRAHIQLEEAGQLVGDNPDPGAGVDAEVRRAQLAGALRMLPESQREVILLRQVLSLSLAETAATLDRSEGAVKQLQLRGLATLRDILGPQRL